MKVTVRIRVAWWLRWYLAGVAVMAQCADLEPDQRKVEAMVRRAVRVDTQA